MFDKIIKSEFNGKIIEHGIVQGDNTILLIKVGQNGSIVGYRDKYLKMAKNINSKYDATVICVSNPFDGKNPLDITMDLIDELSEEKDWPNVRIYYLGISNGGLVGAWYGHLYPEIEKMMLVNMPIQVRNYNYTISGIKASEADEKILVYGELDHSCIYLDLLDELISENDIKLEIVPGQDHNFTFGMTDFITLPEKYFFRD